MGVSTKIARTFGLVGVVASLVVTATPAANAGQPSAGYRTDMVKCSFKDPHDGITMITRTGYYDSASDQGFGYDKANWKHGINSCGAINAVLQSPSRYGTSSGKSTVNFNEWADKIVNGKIVESKLVTAVYEFGDWPTYYGWPAGLPLGLMTIYCENTDNSAKCPSWVNIALANTGPMSKFAPNANTTDGSPDVTYAARYPASTYRP